MALNHPVYGGDASAAASDVSFPTSALVPLTFVDRSANNEEVTVSFTVPAASPYRVRLPLWLVQDEESLPVVTVGAAARTAVRGRSASTGQVALDVTTGEMTFASADASGSAVVVGTPFASPVSADFLHWLQAHVSATQEALLPMVTADATGRACLYVDATVGDDTDGTGSAVAPFATVTRALEVIDTNGDDLVVIYIGPGEYTVDLDEATLPGDDQRYAFVGCGIAATTLTLESDIVQEPIAAEYELYLFCLRDLTLDVNNDEASVFLSGKTGSGVLEIANVKFTGESSTVLTARCNGGEVSGCVFERDTDITGAIASNLTVDSCKLSIGLGSGYTGPVGIENVSISGTGYLSCVVDAIGWARDIVSTSTVNSPIKTELADGCAGKISISEARVVQNCRLNDCAPLTFDEDYEGDIIVRDVYIRLSIAASSGLILVEALSAPNVYIKNCELVSYGVFGDVGDTITAGIFRRNYTGKMVVENCIIDGICIGIFNSHPNVEVDAIRDSDDQPTEIRGNIIRFVQQAEEGPPDVLAGILHYPRGEAIIENNTIIVDTSAGTSIEAARANQAGIYISRTGDDDETPAGDPEGTMAVTVRNNTVVTKFNASATNRAAILISGGSASLEPRALAGSIYGNRLDQQDANYEAIIKGTAWESDTDGYGSLTIGDNSLLGQTSNYTNETPTFAGTSQMVNAVLDNALPLAQGGTGATTASGARTALELGTMAQQAATSVAITGGSINNATIGATVPNTVRGTSVEATTALWIGCNLVMTDFPSPAVTSANLINDDGAPRYALYRIPVVAGAVILQARVSFADTDAAGDGVNLGIYKRDLATSASLTQVGSTQSYLHSDVPTIGTYNVADETAVDGTDYYILITTTHGIAGSNEIVVYGVQAQVGPRRL